MLLTWLFQTHEDCFSRKREKGKHVLEDHVALECVSREEDGEEVCLGPNTQDIPVHNFMQAEFWLEVVKHKAINSWKRAGMKPESGPDSPMAAELLLVPWGRGEPVPAGAAGNS